MKNVIERAFGELNNVFQDEFNKILSQESTNVRLFLSHYYFQRIKLKNMVPKLTHLAMFRNVCVGIHMYSALTYDAIKSFLTHV